MRGLVLEDQTLVAVHAAKNRGLLDRPGSDILPLLLGLLLLGVRDAPSALPVVGELLEEGGLEGCGLTERLALTVSSTRCHQHAYGKGRLGGGGRGHRLDDRAGRRRAVLQSIGDLVSDVGLSKGSAGAEGEKSIDTHSEYKTYARSTQGFCSEVLRRGKKIYRTGFYRRGQ